MQTVELTRVFAAPPELVFQAWSQAEHIRRWFSPEGCSVPEAEIDCRPGGKFEVAMQMPDGVVHWARGRFDDVARPERLAFTLDVEMDGAVRFTARTRVTFAAEGDGTRLTLWQDYTLHDTRHADAPAGAREGWRTTLDKLDSELALIVAPPVVHGVFTLRRDFKASPAQLYHAISDREAKSRWFEGDGSWTLLEREMDVRPGGRERVKGRWANGVVTLFDAVYFDVVPGRRLVYAYDMYKDDQKLSVSLATMQVEPREGGSRLIVTEQGAFLDRYDDAGSREHGTAYLIERIAASLGEPVSGGSASSR